MVINNTPASRQGKTPQTQKEGTWNHAEGSILPGVVRYLKCHQVSNDEWCGFILPVSHVLLVVV